MNDHRKGSCELALCMINYNGEKYLEESLGSVFAQREAFDEFLLIDNASEDKSIEIIRTQFPAVRVIKLDKNMGPAFARNVGFKEASSDLILFMDNDVSLGPNCPVHLLKAINDNPNAAVAMPRVLNAYDKSTIQYDGADSHFIGLMSLHNVNERLTNATDEIRKIGSVVTSCFLLDRKRWKEGPPFDEAFFFNYEDHDFGLRTRIFGHEILSAPSSICYHREGTEGLSIRPGRNYSNRRVFYLIRNRWQTILKNYEIKTILLLFPILFTYEIIQFAGVVKKGWFREWLKALIWMVFHPVQLLRKRRMVQKDRRTPDREILTNGPVPFREDDLIKGHLEYQIKNFLNITATAYWNKIARFI